MTHLVYLNGKYGRVNYLRVTLYKNEYVVRNTVAKFRAILTQNLFHSLFMSHRDSKFQEGKFIER